MSSTEFKKYGGNGALYLTVDRFRQRTFLRRNITQALDQHAEALAAVQPSTDNGMWDHELYKRWDFPDQDTLSVLAAKNKEVLKIDIKHFLPVKRREGGGNVGPSKKKKNLLFTAQCNFVFRLYLERKHYGDDSPDIEDLLYDSRKATLQAYKNEHGEKAFSVEMEKPFLITAEQLKIPNARENGYLMLLAKSYTLTIILLFDDSEDMEMVLPLLNNDHNEMTGHRGKIFTKLGTLPVCPADGKSIPMKFASGGKRYRLPFDMELDAGWEVSKETAMQTYNRALRCVRGLQLPSPVSEPATPAKVTRLAYTFKDQVRPKAIILEGCLCLFCNRRNYHSLDRLHHHFKTEHDMFTFKLESGGRDSPGCDTNEMNIEIDISDKYSDARASNHVADPREISWVAPWEPFDLKAYLDGDESWIATGLGLKSRKYRQFTKPTPLPQGLVEPKKPSEVPDMPRIERKKYRVPKAPSGLRFYRTDSKRPLEEGEYLSESDDGISEDWLKLRRNVATKDAETTIPAKAFMMKWDDYMQDEQLSGDTHAGDAVIRFARKYRSWLKSRDVMGNEFLRKTAELLEDSIICREIFEACVDLIEGDGSMIDAVPLRAQNGRHRPTPSSASEPNGVSPQPKSPKMKRKYVPGGPGGGGRYIEVEDDGKKRKKRSKSAISQETSMSSSQKSFDTLPMTQETDEDIVMTDDIGQEGSTKPLLQDESPQQPSIAAQSGCTCGIVVDDDMVAISCASLVSAMSFSCHMQQKLLTHRRIAKEGNSTFRVSDSLEEGRAGFVPSARLERDGRG